MKFIFKKIFLPLLVLGLLSCGDTAKKESSKTSSNNTPTELNSTPATAKKTTEKKKKILFFGDSLTAGYGLDNPKGDSYVGAIQNRLDSLGMDYETIQAGVSGETSSGGKDRIGWICDQYEFDIFILELGANDGLRGLPVEETTKNLKAIFDTVKEKHPDAKLMVTGMFPPPNMGADFTKKFGSIFPNLAKEYKAALVPFLLDKVGGIPELNQKDRIHPTAKGHLILADNVWTILKDML